MIKAVHLSTYDISGGAAKAAYRLHRGLLEMGVDSRMLVKVKSSDDPTVEAVVPVRPKSLARRLLAERWERFLRERRCRDGAPQAIYHGCTAEFRPQHFSAIRHADIVHLHWTSGFLDWPTVLPWLAKEKPLVWTLHDMNPLLGVLHYQDASETLPLAFERWERAVQRQKAQILAAIPTQRLQFIGPSLWMTTEARALTRFRCEQVPNGICTKTFRPMSEKNAVQRALGIPSGRLVLGFVAQNVGERRKGFAILQEALFLLRDVRERVFLLVAGGNCPEVEGIAALSLGAFDNERMMNLFYNALDLFICPSVQDNLPNTVLEAMSCGVPVAGFKTGGLPDMITDGFSGCLIASPGDIRELANAIRGLTHDRTNCERMGANARKLVVNQFEGITSRIMSLYRQAEDTNLSADKTQSCIRTSAQRV